MNHKGHGQLATAALKKVIGKENKNERMIQSLITSSPKRGSFDSR